MLNKDAWDRLDELTENYPGLGVVPSYGAQRYRIRDIIARKEELGRPLTDEEMKEFELKEEEVPVAVKLAI